MKAIELTPKATEDLESIWFYSYARYGEVKADEYVSYLSDVFIILAAHNVGTSRPELGKDMFSLPARQHVIFFVPTSESVTTVRILNHAQYVCRHIKWR